MFCKNLVHSTRETGKLRPEMSREIEVSAVATSDYT